MTILVIAFKYNDILYAISTQEFKAATRRKLFIICSPDKRAEDFPLTYFFDEVQSITYVDSTNMIPNNLKKAFARRAFLKADTVVLSNPILLITKLIFKLSKATKAVWIEDGLMNYYPLTNIVFKESRWKKKLVQTIFFIPDIEDTAKDFVSYLLEPDQAQSYWGEKIRISLSSSMVEQLLTEDFSFLSGKKIFIGQPLYKDGLLTLEQYRDGVNRIIRDNNIDYYLPHFWSSKDENIESDIFTLNGRKVTLEILACKYNFEVYSISSTVLYSTKLLNNNIKSHMVDMYGLGSKWPIINTIVDDIIK